MERKRCPECGAFLQRGFKEVLARKENDLSQVVETKLSAEHCNKCGYTEVEDYFCKVRSLDLMPY